MTKPVATPSRRAVTRGALWAAPALVVASSAPALAGSVCTKADELVAVPEDKDSQEPGKITFEGPDDLVVTAEIIGNTAALLPGNLSKSGKDVILYQAAATGEYQDVRFTFSKPVYNVKFKVLDLDNGKSQVDSVTVTGEVSASLVKAGFLKIEKGSGRVTVSAPIPNGAEDSVQYTQADPEGQALITSKPGQGLDGFVLRYENRRVTSGRAGQAVWLSPISYTKTNC